MLDPETAMDTVGKASEAATKFQEIMLKVFSPRWTKKQADADAYADERKLQTIRDNPDMEIVYTKDGMNARARTPEAFAYRAEQRMLNEAILQQENLENVFETAFYEVEQIPEVSTQTVDDDWLTRFTNIVKDVSSEDMQRVWAKILAGEIVKPGSYSLKTLEVISNLTAHYASMFQSILPYVIRMGNLYFIPAEKQIMKDYSIAYGDILVLDDIGLTISNPHMQSSLDVLPHSQNKTVYTSEKMLLFTNSSDTAVSVPYHCYILSNAGVELFNTLCVDPDPNLFDDWINFIYDKCRQRDITMSIHGVVDKNEKPHKYSSTPLRELQK